MNQNIQDERGIAIKDLLYVLKKRIILFIVVVVLATSAGVFYSKMQQPKYTANELVFFRAQDLNYDKDVTANISAMLAYVDTVADFCDSGVVVDRADYHYDEYLRLKSQGQFNNVDEYIAWSEKANNNTYNGEISEIKYISADKIKVTMAEKFADGRSQFSFVVSYTDDFSKLAQEKVKILIHSLKLESKVRATNSNLGKYFEGVNIVIIDEGPQGAPTINISRKKTVIMFFMIGVILGLILVYGLYFLNNSVKDKEELERLTGATVLAAIDNNQGGRI